MTVMNVKAKCQELEKKLNKIELNETEWSNSTGELILSVLNEVVNFTNLKWVINDLESSVDFILKNRSNKDIGKLSFILSYNGLVTILSIVYTKRYDPLSEIEIHKVLLTTEPENVRRKIIFEKIADFLDMITQEYISLPTYPRQANQDDEIIHY